MDEQSKKVLQRVEENDPTLIELDIGKDTSFYGVTVSNLSLLGAAIGSNTHLKRVILRGDGLYLLHKSSDDYSVFLNGLKRNSSINDLYLYFRGCINILGNEVLKVYQEINNLTTISIHASLGNNGRFRVVANTLRACTNLKFIDLSHSDITDKQLSLLVDAIKGHNSLKVLDLSKNLIEDEGCEILAVLLLKDPNCNLHTLNLEHNPISNGDLCAIGYELVKNTKLKRLFVDRDAINQHVKAVFSRLSCDILSIDDVGPAAPQTSDTVADASTLTCWICLNGGTDKDGKSLVQECSCRGSAGYVHASCLIGYAQHETKVDYESQPAIKSYERAMQFRKPWEECPNCLQYYDDKGTLPRELASAFAAFVEENYAGNIHHNLETLLLKLESLNRKGTEEGLATGSKMLSLIDQLKEEDPPPPPRSRILDIESAVYNNLGIIHMNADNCEESVQCFQKYLDLSKSLGHSTTIANAERNLAAAKRRLKKKIAAIESCQSDQILQVKQHHAWQRVSMFILGEELTRDSTHEGVCIRNMLQTLLNTVKSGCCCSDVPTGCVCGHCESSMNVIRISRAVILSICKLPLELNDDITRKELERLRSWVCDKVQEFKRTSGKEIQKILPQKLSKLIIELSSIDSTPPWGEDDFALLLQQPSPSWIIRVNMLMLMGYKVILVNFNDVARFSRKNLKVVHGDISRLFVPFR